MEQEGEIERIKKAYQKRKNTIPSYFYSLHNIANLFFVQTREREILRILKKYKMIPLVDKRVLDVGCGVGSELINLVRYGATPENLYGIDVLEDRINEGEKIAPNINFQCGNAETLPYDNEFFDMIMQFTVFTSILSDRMKEKIAGEMIRVLKPGGIIVWYDYHMDNPKNPDVKGVKKKEIYRLFTECEIILKRITLAPPLVRTMAPYAWAACYLLEKLKILNTHYIGVIKRDY
jgi:ubiquinone/menaquinone biosynthesis C-methylase UbiE